MAWHSLMDVVTDYLYDSFDSDIHIKISEGLKIQEINDTCFINYVNN